MKKAIRIFSVLLLATSIVSHAQTGTVDSIKFFTDEALISMTLTTDIRQLQTEKKQDVFQPATVSMKFPDSSVIEESIMVGARGKFRRSYCRIPPMMLNFRNTTSPRLNPLGKLKLVIGCGIKEEDEELLLKEFLVYKIYNILEDRSFRVRLLNVNYNDSRGKVKSFSQYAFLIEDDGDMARRNGCRKKADAKFLTEATNRDMMTMVALFQYMIGNTDWAVPNNHNIKLIYERGNEAAPPIVVPYDFDYCGLVNAGYAIPNEIIGTEKVTERVYRGFPRTLEEIQITLDIFRSKKDSILSLINNFPLLGNRAKKEMINYLEEFFRMINNKGEVKSVFVDNARTS
ncbi:MAG TPA: hypothetical protein PKI55_16005 [Chitinophagaceae bacterium]|nr:hypothetical protein [Chitinophagaceae bacterium]